MRIAQDAPSADGGAAFSSAPSQGLKPWLPAMRREAPVTATARCRTNQREREGAEELQHTALSASRTPHAPEHHAGGAQRHHGGV